MGLSRFGSHGPISWGPVPRPNFHWCERERGPSESNIMCVYIRTYIYLYIDLRCQVSVIRRNPAPLTNITILGRGGGSAHPVPFDREPVAWEKRVRVK